MHADSLPLTAAPGLSRLFLEFCSGSEPARRFYSSLPAERAWLQRPAVPAHWPELVSLLAAQNSSVWNQPAFSALQKGAGVMITGQQVGILGGPLFTPFKAATAIARAQQATTEGAPHVAVFWLASEDHDFAEINHVVLPRRRELSKLIYAAHPPAAVPVGSLALEASIAAVIAEARLCLEPGEALDALEAAYQPGTTLAQAFAAFYSNVFAAQGLLVFDPSSRAAHQLGAPVLRAAIERSDELHVALLERNAALLAAGFHAQVAVGADSSLLFLIEEKTGARLALKRQAATSSEPNGLWKAGRHSFSTDELLGILASEPERISPAALLRPIFQDFLFSSSAIIGGPAEIAYFAQSAVLYERILGRTTPALPRFTATLVEPEMARLLDKHQLTLQGLWGKNEAALTELLAERALPPEGRKKIEAVGEALDSELAVLLDWMRAQEAGLGRSAETAASKMRYQMGRMRRLAANFALSRAASLGREAAALERGLAPGGVLQERTVGAAYFLARYGFGLAERMVEAAGDEEPRHAAIWL